MSGFPVVLDGDWISALVVGGGKVGVRKAAALRSVGARVRIVSRDTSAELDQLRRADPSIRITVGAYQTELLEGMTYAVAATSDPAVNAMVAADARARGILVNVVDRPELGTCVTPAVHRAGDIVIAVSAGVPKVAVRIRDHVGSLIDDRFAEAARLLRHLRRRMLERGQSQQWQEASRALVAADFFQSVEEGTLRQRLSAWD